MFKPLFDVRRLPHLIMYACVLNLFAPAQGFSAIDAADHTLWYTKPAQTWQSECLPIGNGSLGCMVYGSVDREHIQFNQDTLWVGSENDTGSYQNFGDIYVELPHSDATDYRRELDISRAVQTITYKAHGIAYKREYFSSRPANVMVFRYTADKTQSLTGTISLVDAHGAPTTARANRLTASGDLQDHQFYRNSINRIKTWTHPIVLDYESQLLVINQGGTLKTDNHTISFQDCDSLTILVAAGTDYLNQRSKGWKGEHPHTRLTAYIDSAATRAYDDLLAEHIRDYHSIYNRCAINVGTSDSATRSQPTNVRLAAYKRSNAAPTGARHSPDPDLEELLFQYARYLMISCSRPGCMPSNLQGLWNESNHPPWRCDYHSDVNTQMHYWFVDQANLSECFSPLAEWFYSIRDVRRDATKAHFGTRGFAMHAENGIFGGSTFKWSVGDASWLANNLMDHYLYTLDKEYLRTRAYPIMNDLFMFWEDHLKEIPAPNGEGTVLVAPDGFSPEHGPHEDGVSFDQQLAWDLLSNVAEAARVLGVDQTLQKKALRMRDHLLGPQIGKWGQIQEWMIDRDDPKDQHRHLSHMVAVHPSRQISPLTTPRLAQAATVSMNARGDGTTGWSKAWKINIWARLHDGNRAYKLLNEQIKSNHYSNLFNICPPFQIDGNFGYASGVCEMLVQSHMGLIHLLPALPDAWANGHVKGIRARGGFVLDLDWKEGTLTKALIHSEAGTVCQLRTTTPLVVTCEGKTIKPNTQTEEIISFPTQAGQEYLVVPRNMP